ncbi:MAG: hypothetical protein EZS28_025332 [Streblomastix strix]|uniref:Tyr recombinase domain-containing protein n=1 Tax=Streblomastix strix TaxID=222440 RepID=A0A5J4V9Q4_9EUKA|nr:MAG: hypothetical protein EZS28_025332 [Streblomastix strix]
MLTEIIRKAGIPEKYSVPTIRNAMMTKLRARGATQAEVNAYTRHSLTSNVVDAYYCRPVERDLGALLLSNEQRYDNIIYITLKNDDYTIVSILLQQSEAPTPCENNAEELEDLRESLNINEEDAFVE